MGLLGKIIGMVSDTDNRISSTVGGAADMISTSTVTSDVTESDHDLGRVSDTCVPGSGTVYDRNRAVGDAFEDTVLEHLGAICCKFGGETYHSIVVPTGTVTTEVDIVVAVPSAIFVVECKNWAGTVYANYDQYENWVRVKADGTRNQFYSPIKQNNTHLRALQEYLGVKNRQLKSVVLFPDTTTLKKLPPHGDELFVGKLSDFCRYLGAWVEHHPTAFVGVEMCKMRLEQAAHRSEYNESRHHEQMQKC